MFGFWPYTNFHQLNLDWIIKEVKENNRKVEEFSQQLEEMGITVQQMQEYIDNLDAEIQEKIDTEVPAAIQEEISTGGFNQLLSESHKRRIVFIGDSYGQGWTPDGRFTSWCEIVKNIFGLNNADYVIEAQGGAGFGKSATEGRQYVPTLIQAAYQNITNPETVTDIVIGLGYNDYTRANDTSVVSTGLQNTVVSCKNLFPTARIHIFAIGFTTQPSKQYALNVVYNKAYAKEPLDYSFYNISESLNHISYFSSDGIHPVQIGHNKIALNVVRCLCGGTPVYNYGNLAHDDVEFELLLGNNGQITDTSIAIATVNNKLFATTNGQFKIVTIGNSGTISLNGNVAYKLAKLHKMGDYTGYFNPDQYVSAIGKMFVQKQGESGFTDFDVMLSIGTDSNHTDIFLYITILGTNGSNFMSTGAFTSFSFQGFCLELPFITRANEFN